MVVKIQELSNTIGKGLYFLLFTDDLLSCNRLHAIPVQSGGNVSCSLLSFCAQENEDAVDFAGRVKREIAKQGGLVDLDW